MSPRCRFSGWKSRNKQPARGWYRRSWSKHLLVNGFIDRLLIPVHRENGCSVASRRIVLQLEHKPWLKQIKLFSSTLYSWGGPLRLTVECLEGWVDLFQTDMKFEEKIEGKNLHAIVSKDVLYTRILACKKSFDNHQFLYLFRKVITMKFTC